MRKVTLLFLGTTGAGPVYSLEMAKSLVALNQYNLQVVIADGLLNRETWVQELGESVKFEVVKTYRHTRLGVLLSFLSFWRPLRVVRLINRFNPDILYLPFGLVWSPIVFPLLNKSISIIYTLHDPYPHDNSSNILSTCYDKIANKARDKYSSGVVILNNRDKDYVHKNICSNVVVIPHASFGYYSQVKKNDSRAICNKKIGFIGRIEPYKGLDILLDAYQLVKNEGISLLIAGSGYIPDDLMSIISSDDSITLINRYINDNDFTLLLDSVDFVVLPYKRASQSGIIPMAFAYGKAVIATNVGALSEQVPSGTGIIVSPSAHDLAQAILRFYKDNLFVAYGKNAQEYASSYLTWEHSARCLSDFINKV